MTLSMMINRHGQGLTLRHKSTAGAYDPTTGAITGSATEDITIVGYFFNYDLEEINGTSVVLGDRKLLVYAKDSEGYNIEEPLVGDKIIGQGDTVGIVSVRKILSGSTIKCYILQVRE